MCPIGRKEKVGGFVWWSVSVGLSSGLLWERRQRHDNLYVVTTLLAEPIWFWALKC